MPAFLDANCDDEEGSADHRREWTAPAWNT